MKRPKPPQRTPEMSSNRLSRMRIRFMFRLTLGSSAAVTFRAPSLICFRKSSASLSPWGDRKEMTIVLPPVEPDLLRLGDGAHGHPNAHCEELDLGDRDANVAGDGKALVEHAVENIDGADGPMMCTSTERKMPSSSASSLPNRPVIGSA